MKSQEIGFKHTVKIFQVFRYIHNYKKSEKSFDDRKDKVDWNTVPSKSGHIFKDELYLPENILNDPRLMTCDLIMLEDDLAPIHSQAINMTKLNGVTSNPKSANVHCLHLDRKCTFDIFEIKHKEHLELHLRYGYFEVGIPTRENFKLCEIREKKPIEIKINGKIESSLTSRRARVFKEQTYIITYLGDFSQSRILKEPFSATLKKVPTNRKVVDLVKPLW
jgi:hypothetical protein